MTEETRSPATQSDPPVDPPRNDPPAPPDDPPSPASEAGKREEPSPAPSHIGSHLHGGSWKTPRKLRRGREHDLAGQMKRKMLAVRVAVVTSLLFLLTALLAVVLYLQLMQTEAEHHETKNDAAQTIGLLEADKQKLRSEIATLKEERTTLESHLLELQDKLNQVETERDELLKNDSVIQSLRSTILSLTAEIAEKDAAIKELEDKLYRDDPVNVEPMLEAMQLLHELLQSGAPLKTVSVEKFDEYGLPYYVDEQIYPNLSLYLHDTATGLSYVWESKKVYETAELHHLIYAIALLECAEREVLASSAAVSARDLVYNLEDTYTLKRSDILPGAGVLKNQREGTVYTYLELTTILLTYSDVTAYHLLSTRFGNEPLNILLADLDGFSSKESFDAICASDLMILLDRVSALCARPTYGEELRSALTNAVSTGYSQAAGGTVGKQCSMTRSGYIEANLTFEKDHEMRVVLLTDITEFDAEWSRYLSSLMKAANQVMRAFRG